MGDVKGKIVSPFKTNTNKNYNVYKDRKKPKKQSKGKIIKAFKGRIIRDNKNLN